MSDCCKSIERWLDRNRPRFLASSALMSVGAVGVVSYTFWYKYAPLQYQMVEKGIPD